MASMMSQRSQLLRRAPSSSYCRIIESSGSQCLGCGTFAPARNARGLRATNPSPSLGVPCEVSDFSMGPLKIIHLDGAAAQTTKSDTIGQLKRLALGCSAKEEKLSRFALSAIARKATSLYLLKGRTVKLVIVFLAFGIGLGTPALAQSPTAPPAAPSANDIQFTNHDIVTLLKATKDAETSPNITIDIVGKVDTDMPAYDPIVHFVGIDAKSGAAMIWIKSPARRQLLLRPCAQRWSLRAWLRASPDRRGRPFTIKSRHGIRLSERTHPTLTSTALR
jgi:hypothetical protein